MMKVLNAMDLKSGKKAERSTATFMLTPPSQFIPKKEKNEDWVKNNIDWYEYQGLIQLKQKARRLLKNYKLAAGIIDKSDYIIEEDNEEYELLEQLIEEDISALELKFYPIIPNVINVLTNEFAKRDTSISWISTDDISYNELLEEKRKAVESVLVQKASAKLKEKLLEQGVDLENEEAQQQFQQQLQSLPEIQEYYDKSYSNLLEQWCEHQYRVDLERYKIDELEELAFRDMLITDSEFWHFKMLEDDYDIELWNPVLTFYIKSPNQRYISEGHMVGKFEMMTVSDIIDKYGWVMTEDQIKSLESLVPARGYNSTVAGGLRESNYDPSKSYSENVNGPSIGFKQYTSFIDNIGVYGQDIVNWITAESEDFLDFYSAVPYLRVTTVYWKSKRRIGHLTKITETGEVIKELVDEDYKITDKPIYDTHLFNEKSERTLIFGEHIEWLWVNEVWGGVKIGKNINPLRKDDNVDAIYLGINQNKPSKLKYQFKGSKTLFGCRLPVEGAVFTDRNTKSTSCVDLMKPYQIAYNIVNNQIADILVDELGSVILLDQNALPKHSLGEDWGENNYAKAYTAMKDFSILPLDTTITNTENALNFNHFQVLNLEQTNRLLSRVNLANYFKQQAFENIGISPQRMGMAIEQETAEGVRAAVNNSYALTEQYFINHSDRLMPRIHEMRTQLAQFYNSTKPSVRLKYITTEGQKIHFALDGKELLMRDFNVFATTKANHRAILEKMRSLALSNNTSGASIYDLGDIIKAQNLADLEKVLKNIERKSQEKIQQEQQYQQQLLEQKLQAEKEQQMKEQQFEAEEAAKERQKDILVAEIRAAGYGSMMDVNENKVSDFQDAMKEIKETNAFNEQMNLKKIQHSDKVKLESQKLDIEKEKLDTMKKISEDKLRIAKENKNKYDFMSESKKKEKERKGKKQSGKK